MNNGWRLFEAIRRRQNFLPQKSSKVQKAKNTHLWNPKHKPYKKMEKGRKKNLKINRHHPSSRERPPSSERVVENTTTRHHDGEDDGEKKKKKKKKKKKTRREKPLLLAPLTPLSLSLSRPRIFSLCYPPYSTSSSTLHAKQASDRLASSQL